MMVVKYFARIVTGLPSFASIHSIYIETGWEKLKTRREVRKLMLFNKIVNGQVPDYLTELVPPTVGDTNNYNLRNRLNISQPSYRLSTYRQSLSVSKRKVRRYSFRLKIFLLQFGFKRRKCRQLTKVQI
jgi:hypothetical protein